MVLEDPPTTPYPISLFGKEEECLGKLFLQRARERLSIASFLR